MQQVQSRTYHLEIASPHAECDEYRSLTKCTGEHTYLRVDISSIAFSIFVEGVTMLTSLLLVANSQSHSKPSIGSELVTPLFARQAFINNLSKTS
jgi:hypothetical protein